MSTLEFRTAIRDAIAEEIERDPAVIFFGEDVGRRRRRVQGHARACTSASAPSASFDTPISELALAGAAFGAAVTGLRPVIEIMFGDFMALPMDSLVNQAAKYWYISNEQAQRARSSCARRSAAAAASARSTPRPTGPGSRASRGSRSRCPSSSAEAKGLLKGAIRDDNPVIFLEHKRLYSVKDEVARHDRGDPARQGARSRARATT